MPKKWLLILAASVVLLGMLAGCGGGEETNSSGQDNAANNAQENGGENASGSENGSDESGNDEEAAGGETISLTLSHQWPQATEDEGDFRGQLAVKFANAINEKSDGQIEIDIYPASSLVGATEQYDAMLSGGLDMSVYPLDYAGGQVPQFSATLMPALVRNHEEAAAWENAEIGQKIREIAEENGIKILVWVWNAGGIGTKGDPIISPEDIASGMKTRAAGARVEAMLASQGAGIQSMPSSEIYSAMQTGVLDAAITSASSFSSYKLHEQVSSYTSPTENTFWFMFEPLVISMNTWESLTPEQQALFEEAAAELQEFAYTASAEDDARVEEEFKENGVDVYHIDDAAYEKWVEVSKPIWEEFASEVEGGQELIDLAQQVSAE